MTDVKRTQRHENAAKPVLIDNPEPSAVAEDARAPLQATRAGAATGKLPPELGGQKGPEPTRYGDWEKNSRCTDF